LTKKFLEVALDVIAVLLGTLQHATVRLPDKEMLDFLEKLIAFCLLLFQSSGSKTYPVSIPIESAKKVDLFRQVGLIPENASKTQEDQEQLDLSESHLEKMLTVINFAKTIYIELSGKFQTNIDFLMDTNLALERYDNCLLLAKIKPDLAQKPLFVLFDRMFKILKESEGKLTSFTKQSCILGEVRTVGTVPRLRPQVLQFRPLRKHVLQQADRQASFPLREQQTRKNQRRLNCRYPQELLQQTAIQVHRVPQTIQQRDSKLSSRSTSKSTTTESSN
jgi:hypothetical protein